VPGAYAGASYTVLPTSTANATHWQLDVLCKGCSQWEGGSLNPNGVNTLAWAKNTRLPNTPSSNTSTFGIHDARGTFLLDLSVAKIPQEVFDTIESGQERRDVKLGSDVLPTLLTEVAAESVIPQATTTTSRQPPLIVTQPPIVTTTRAATTSSSRKTSTTSSFIVITTRQSQQPYPIVSLFPTVSTTTTWGPQPPAGNLALPTLTGLPTVGLPTVGLPTVGLPTVNLPTVGLPTVGLPTGVGLGGTVSTTVTVGPTVTGRPSTRTTARTSVRTTTTRVRPFPPWVTGPPKGKGKGKGKGLSPKERRDKVVFGPLDEE
jgi:hypothetical protein